MRGLGITVADESWCFAVVACLLPRGCVARSAI